MMKYLFTILTIFTVTGTAHAQDSRIVTPPDQLSPPTIIPAEPNLKPMELTKLDVDVRIQSELAETQMTMTFYNPNDRVLAGDLYFPLPEGALVSGYALDVQRKMRGGPKNSDHVLRWIDVLKDAWIKISMDGKGRWIDNRMIERLWRSLKYECVYLNAFETGSEARKDIGKWITYYNAEGPRSTHGILTPNEVYDNKTKPVKLAA